MSMFQIVILGIFSALAVSGVIIFAFVVGGQQTEKIGPVEMWGTFDDAPVNAALRQLAEADSRFKNITYVEKKPETYASELTQALAAGRGPDVFIMRQDEAMRDGEKAISIPYEGLPKEQFQNTFVEAANPFLTAEGVTAVPLLVDPLVMYWNKDILATAGFSQPPKTWDELYDFSTKVTKRDDTNSIQKSALAFGEFQNVTHAKDVLSLLILQAGGRITTYQGDSLVPSLSSRTSDAQQSSDAALRFYTEFANPTNVYYSWNRAQRESRLAFSGNSLALYFGFASEEPLIRQTNPNLNFAVAGVPQLKAKDTAINVGTVYALAIPRASDNLAGAQQAVYILASAESSSLFSKAVGIPSARRDVLAGSASGLDELFNKQAIIVRAWVDPDPGKTEELFRVMIESVASGAAKIGEAIQRAEDGMAALIRQ